MAYWLCPERKGQKAGFVSRFDPLYWTVNFPRPMMASVTTTAPDALRVDAVFYRKDDLAGLIWEAEDRYDHPLLRYETSRDFRACTLSFRWRSSGVIALDAINDPVLTIEGRDAGGNAKSWFVRLWNYASGTPGDAQVTIDFAHAVGGFALPGAADPVWAGDVDRMFISLVPPGYDAAGGNLAAPVEAWAELTGMACTGSGSVLEAGDAIVPEHGLCIASGYDDSYNLTPARLLRNALQLGYRGAITHYLGMSHYFRLEPSGDGFYVSLSGGVLNVAAAAWHRDFAARAHALGYEIIWSQSYEILDQHCWNDWKQRAADGSAALTGWDPPSALLSPAHDGAMGYLRQLAAAVLAIALEAGLAPKFQIGEPWWWVMADGRPCLYDDAAKTALGGAPVAIVDVRGALGADQLALLDAAGVLLATSTAALAAAARAAAPDVQTHVLVYLPTVLAADAPEVRRMNCPAGWARPAFDVLQLEDYDWVTAGDVAASARGVDTAETLLGYPVADQHYFSGFVLNPADAAEWAPIEAAAQRARGRGVTRSFVWALPRVLRDGFTHFDQEDDMAPFDDVLFPLALGAQAEVSPGFSTPIVTSAGGHEARNASWAEARAKYDVGPGVRSEADITTLLAFFRARMGPARGFRLRDPFDWHGVDEPLGTGDGIATRFALVRHYDAMTRAITRPVVGSVTVKTGGVPVTAFSILDGGIVELDVPPAAGVVVTASFDFDVPVRFAEDSLSVSRATFLAGAAPNVPLIEIREAA